MRSSMQIGAALLALLACAGQLCHARKPVSDLDASLLAHHKKALAAGLAARDKLVAEGKMPGGARNATAGPALARHVNGRWVPGDYPHSTSWGDWHGPVGCPPNSWASGFEIRVEVQPPRAPNSFDDTATNAIRLICTDLRGNRVGEKVSPHDGHWGAWCDASCNPGCFKIGTHPWTQCVDCNLGAPGGGCPNANCPRGKHIEGFALQVEAPRGSKEDDTSVNGVLAVCNDGHDRPLVAHGQWGTWRPYQFCPPGWGVDRLWVRIEKPQGSGDDTALNNIRFECSPRR